VIVASRAAGALWEEDLPFLRCLEASDLIVINGEGTLHHGAAAGERLLRIASHPLRKGRPIALINTMWQDNPTSWQALVRLVDLVVVRDRRSQRALGDLGIEVELCPDLSLSHVWTHARWKRDPARLAFGDSVFRSVARALLEAYRDHPEPRIYLPIRARRRHERSDQRLTVRQRLDNARHYLRAQLQSVRDPNRLMVETVEEYTSHLAQCGLHLTGRYHAVCLSIATGTPFIAVTSNSQKIEALIDDIGLDPRRASTSVREALNRSVRDFSASEKAKIAAWLDLARRRSDEVLDRVAALAPQLARIEVLPD
jgi:polysaccharide pyruvyl transferase WcaK-like protein